MTTPDLTLYLEALDGTLASDPTGNPSYFEIVNATSVPLSLYLVTEGRMLCGVDAQGWVEGGPGVLLAPNSTVSYVVPDVEDGMCFVVRVAASGAFVCVLQKEGSSTGPVVIDAGLLLEPGVVGPIPQPTAFRKIPMDSPRVLVGYGTAPDGQVLTREQYWRLSPDSYSLAPGERVTASVTNVSGMEATSSRQETMAASLSASLSGGWGAISASLSASLSASSTTFQQLTVNDQTTSFRSSERHNDTPDAVMCLLWQLTDVVTVYAGTIPVAAVATAMAPPIIEPLYTIGHLPPTPTKQRLLRDARSTRTANRRARG